MRKASRSLIAWFGRLVWPEAPRAESTPGAVNSAVLTLKFCEVLHYAIAGNLGASGQDLVHAQAVRGTLQRILFDYRSGKAQTIEERSLGSMLDHVALTYLQRASGNTKGPRFCRGCGCDDHNACSTPQGPCAWAEIYPDGSGLCNACIDHAAGNTGITHPEH